MALAAPIHDIHWLTAPLVIYTRTGLHLLPRPAAKISEKLAHTSRMEHWAIQVEDVCYEVTSVEKEPGTSDLTWMGTGGKCYELVILPAEEWWRKYNGAGIVVKRVKVGKTEDGRKERERIANLIWKNYHQTAYSIANRNCQNFAFLFKHLISLPSNDQRVSFSEMESWIKMSVPFSHLLAGSAKAGMGLGGMAKAAGVLTVTHPVLGLGAFVALAVVARKKDKHWMKKWLSQMQELEMQVEALEVQEEESEAPKLPPRPTTMAKIEYVPDRVEGDLELDFNGEKSLNHLCTVLEIGEEVDGVR